MKRALHGLFLFTAILAVCIGSVVAAERVALVEYFTNTS